MTVTMSEKHQVTIPKKIADILNLKKGSLFTVEVRENRIELIPVEVKERVYTAEDYRKLDRLRELERGKEKKVTRTMIANMKRGKR